MIVYVVLTELILLKISLTRPVYVCVVVCPYIWRPVVAFHVLPLKLYAFELFIPIPVSVTHEIANIPVVHSYTEAPVNINVGAVASYIYSLELPVPTLPAVSSTLKLIVMSVV